MLPLPVPLDPELIVIHKLVLDVTHVQFVELVVTVTRPVSEPAPCDLLEGETARPQFVPHCVSERYSPPMLRTPERCTALRFELTE